MLKSRIRKLNIATALGSLLLSAATAGAQDQVTIKFSNLWPEAHYMWQEGGKHFVEAVTEATGGNVAFQEFHASQLGKDQLTLLSSNIAQMAMVAIPYAPDKLTLSGVTELPGMFTTSCEGSNKLFALAQEGGVLATSELDALGLHVLFTTVPPAHKIMTTKTEVASLDDMKGLKIRTVGGAQADTVRALGGVPVQVTAGELYDSLSRGTIDGAMYIWVGVPPFDLQNLIGFSTEGAYGGAGGVLYGIRKDTWDQLPDDVKAAMTEAGKAAQKNLCEYQDNNENPLRDQFVAEKGLKVTTLSDEQIALWQEAMAGVGTAWAARMDGSGRPGTEVLEAFRAAPTE